MIGLRHCGQRTIVLDTRRTRGHTTRRRECVVCKERFTTREVFVPEEYISLTIGTIKPQCEKSPRRKKVFIRYCKDCRVELTGQNLVKPRGRICKDCIEARERQPARYIKKERAPFEPPIGKQELIDLYQRYNLRQLAARHNCHAETIRNWMKHYGITRRPRGSRVNRIREHVIKVDGRKREPMPPNCPRCVTKPRARGLCASCYVKWINQGKPPLFGQRDALLRIAETEPE
jgi:hypothetical protein